jgi:ATP-dependent RNA helicase DHX57
MPQIQALLASKCGGYRSDPLIVALAMKAFVSIKATSAQRKFCRDNSLSFERMHDLHKEQRELLKSLVSVKLLASVEDGMQLGPSTRANRHTNSVPIVCAAIAAGVYPQIVKIVRPPSKFVETIGGALEKDVDVKEMKFYLPLSSCSDTLEITESAAVSEAAGHRQFDDSNADHSISTAGMQRVFIHPTSINFDNNAYKHSSYLIYNESQRVVGNPKDAANTTKYYVRETSEVGVYTLLLFGGELSANYSAGIISVDKWIRFAAPGRIVALIQGIRRELDSLLVRAVSADGVSFDDHTGTARVESMLASSPVLDVVIKLLMNDGL